MGEALAALIALGVWLVTVVLCTALDRGGHAGPFENTDENGKITAIMHNIPELGEHNKVELIPYTDAELTTPATSKDFMRATAKEVCETTDRKSVV